MPWELNDITEDELVAWIKTHLASNTSIHARGYQGNVYLYQDKGRRLIIKAAAGAGLVSWLRTAMLRNEYRVYEKLRGFTGSPRCYGLVRGRYLVLEYIDGAPIRDATIGDQETFFTRLLELIKELHRRGIAHTDLKRKDNLLVVDGLRPCLIDFGAAVVYRPGFHPLNHFLFDLAKQFDHNAWVKLKHRYIEQAPEKDLAYYRFTRIERLARWIKRRYLKIKQRLLKKT